MPRWTRSWGWTPPHSVRVGGWSGYVVRRRLDAGEHPLINQLAREATSAERGATLSHVIADWTQISRAEADRRIREAADLGERCALTGEPLAPVLAATAAAQHAGVLGREQVAVIRGF